MLVLALDASTYVGTVALVRDDSVVAERAIGMRGERAERLMPAVADTMAAARVQPRDLDALACGGGPGSFTSLRIAASIAKGMAAALSIPLLVAPSPLLIAAGADAVLASGPYLALLDAMRGEVFAQELELGRDGRIERVGDAFRVTREQATDRARSSGARLIGPIEEPSHMPHARGFAAIVRDGIGREVDARSWEPEYGRKAEAQVRWEVAHGRPLEGA
jgi:tRNA threonylcarbamoyladenosine biosynthesis protein TsaB